MLANPTLFGLDKEEPGHVEDAVWEKASEVGSKTQFALQYATQTTPWNVPRYIAEGLRWLAGPPDATLPATLSPAPEQPEVAVAEVLEEVLHA